MRPIRVPANTFKRKSFGSSANKYGAKRTKLDGRTFDSKGESQRYAYLKLLEKQGAITGLECQVPFKIMHDGQWIATFNADFVYWICGQMVVEDFKSSATCTPVYRLKKKLLKIMMGIEIKEVDRPREAIG